MSLLHQSAESQPLYDAHHSTRLESNISYKRKRDMTYAYSSFVIFQDTCTRMQCQLWRSLTRVSCHNLPDSREEACRRHG